MSIYNPLKTDAAIRLVERFANQSISFMEPKDVQETILNIYEKFGPGHASQCLAYLNARRRSLGLEQLIPSYKYDSDKEITLWRMKTPVERYKKIIQEKEERKSRFIKTEAFHPEVKFADEKVEAKHEGLFSKLTSIFKA